MLAPVVLFAVTLSGFLLAVGYFAYTNIFGGRLVAKCRVPGEAVFDLDPGMSPVEVSAYLGPGVRNRDGLRVELEHEGTPLWSRDVLPGESRGLLDDAVSVRRFRVEASGRYRLRGISGDRTSPAVAAIHVYVRRPQPHPSVYVLSGLMLAGGFVSLLIVLG